MADMINDDQIPVFLINGFLESGKTSFINYTMSEEYFHIDGNTLLIVSEEGEVEYDEENLKREKTRLFIAEDISDLSRENLKRLQRETRAERVVIELNGMWDPAQIDFPEDWLLYQQITCMDGTTLTSYLNNMKTFFGPMLRDTELVIINRCDGIPNATLVDWKRKLRPLMPQESMIVFEGKEGEIEVETIPEELPYDVNADIIEIVPETFGVWFFDARDYPERYIGKKISLKGSIQKHRAFDRNCFVLGMDVMTCCEADIRYIGYMCHYDGIASYRNDSWVKVTALFKHQFVKEYEQEGPFLEILDIAMTTPVNGAVGI